MGIFLIEIMVPTKLVLSARQSWVRESTFFHPVVNSSLSKPGSFTYLFQVHKIHFHWVLSMVWMTCWLNPVNVGSKSGGVGSLF